MHRWHADRAPGGSSRTLLLAMAAACLLSAPASADGTVRERTVPSGPDGIGNGARTTMKVMARDQSRTDVKDTCTERLPPQVGGKARQAMRDARTADLAVASLDSVTEEIDAAAGRIPEHEADTHNAQADAEDTRASAKQQQDAQDRRPSAAEAASQDERPAGIKTVEHELPTVPSTRK